MFFVKVSLLESFLGFFSWIPVKQCLFILNDFNYILGHQLTTSSTSTISTPAATTTSVGHTESSHPTTTVSSSSSTTPLTTGRVLFTNYCVGDGCEEVKNDNNNGAHLATNYCYGKYHHNGIDKPEAKRSLSHRPPVPRKPSFLKKTRPQSLQANGIQLSTPSLVSSTSTIEATIATKTSKATQLTNPVSAGKIFVFIA